MSASKDERRRVAETKSKQKREALTPAAAANIAAAQQDLKPSAGKEGGAGGAETAPGTK
jgi:hypothetical protein